ncbi:MAG: DUF262 domain-containing protein [Candidatus Riflebacteria bacterium]|nr:DUF262 domain-containing protein [Candidatus Riflebacteria bacterium]
MKVRTILDQIDLGAIALPEFQRGYVWNRDQVRNFMWSLYRKHPVGSLLVWATKVDSTASRGDSAAPSGTVELLLDGQQRITSLYGLIRGKPPRFFDGNALAFSGLFFHLDEEQFEFYAPMKMKDNPLWLDVTDLMKTGSGTAIQRMVTNPVFQKNLPTYVNRLNAIDNIKEIELHIEKVSGEDKTVDVVVDIFNRVNTGGTKLSKGDLALARICAAWPEARDTMKGILARWRNAGFEFRLELLMRCVNALLTGEALFSAMKDVTVPAFREALGKTEKAIDFLLNTVSSRLGLDHDAVLGSHYAFPTMVRYYHDGGGKIPDSGERDRLLYWFVHAFLWGRYSGSTESVLTQDLNILKEGKGITGLIDLLRRHRGNLTLNADDFKGWSRGARFYPLLYLLTRVGAARDWDWGTELKANLLGKLSALQVHHIFPKKILYEHGYEKAEVNALANLTFLTQETNLLVSDTSPENYIPGFMKKNPGAIESHWIPMDPLLWKVERFPDFLAARRELLAKAANQFLESLVTGKIPEGEPVANVLDRQAPLPPGSISTDEEERHLQETNQWVVEQGLPEGELRFELVEEPGGTPLAILDLAWPSGVQEGLSAPVALILNEGQEVEEAANRLGYRFFKSVGAFKAYIEQEVLKESTPLGK